MLKITEISAIEVGESRRDKSKPLLGACMTRTETYAK